MIDNRINWDHLSSAYQSSVTISTRDVHYGPNGAGEESLTLFEQPLFGVRILDVGCGGGQNSIALAKRGAEVTGVDFSSAQLDYAKKLASKENVLVRFIEDDIQHLKSLPPYHYNAALCCFASEYVENFTDFVGNVLRTLRVDGYFILADLHPFASAGESNCPSLSEFIPTIGYFRQGKRTFTWKNIGTPVALRRYHRTLEDYLNAFRAHGAYLADLKEPTVDDEGTAQTCPYYDLSLKQNAEIWRHLPYTIVMKIKRQKEI